MLLSTLIASVSIDVDVTALYMALAFIVFYFAFQPIIVTPYLRAREMRRDAIDGAREEASESEALANATMAEFEEEMKSARREAAEVRETLKNQGTSEQQDLVEEARIRVQASLAAERGTIAAQVAEAEKELQARAASLSKAIVEKILPAVS